MMPLPVSKFIQRPSTPPFRLVPATRVVIFANVTFGLISQDSLHTPQNSFDLGSENAFGFTSILYGVGQTVWLPVVMK